MNATVEPEDLTEESRLLFFASYTLERLRQNGHLEDAKNTQPFLTRKEYAFVRDMIQRNLCTFEDLELEAAIVYTAEAAGLDTTFLMRAVRSMLADA